MLPLQGTSGKYILIFQPFSDAARSQIISSSPQCTSHCRPTYPRSPWACWVLMNEPHIKLKYGKSRRGYHRNILPWELLESLMTNGTKRSPLSPPTPFFIRCCFSSRISVSCDFVPKFLPSSFENMNLLM